jgi:proteasome accessory factor B
MAREYETSSRTILRDIGYMKDMLRAPIEYDETKKGYYYSEPDYRLPDIGMRESDFFALMIAEKALSLYENTPVYERLKNIFDRLISLLPEKITIKTSWLDSKYSFLPERRTSIDAGIWENLSDALRLQKTVHIVHRSPGKEKTKREVDPYHMANYRGEWYLIGYCHRKKEILKFAVSRIEQAEMSERTFPYPSSFSFEKYMGPNFGIMTDSEEYRVLLHFEKESAPFVRERIWHREQRIEENADGSLQLSFITNSIIEVKKWILSWGSGVKVLEPKFLAQTIEEELTKALKKYRG